jgi:hypothetical protein
LNGPCPGELSALLACVGDSAEVDCSTRGRVFAGCEAESLALQVCDARAREQLCAVPFPRCRAYCEPLTLSFCAQGPESVTSCLCGCEATLVAGCSAQLDAFMTCSSDSPSFGCDASGRPAAQSCATEWQSLSICARGSTDAPDAGG